MEQLSVILASLASAYVGEYGWAVQVVAVVGSLRLFFKPIVSALESAVASTESKNDDVILGKVKENSFYKAFVFVLDLVGSIKIKK